MQSNHACLLIPGAVLWGVRPSVYLLGNSRSPLSLLALARLGRMGAGTPEGIDVLGLGALVFSISGSLEPFNCKQMSDFYFQFLDMIILKSPDISLLFWNWGLKGKWLTVSFCLLSSKRRYVAMTSSYLLFDSASWISSLENPIWSIISEHKS